MRHDLRANSVKELLELANALVTEYETISSTHITWYTHKNPYGCWICDILKDFRQVLYNCEQLLTIQDLSKSKPRLRDKKDVKINDKVKE